MNLIFGDMSELGEFKKIQFEPEDISSIVREELINQIKVRLPEGYALHNLDCQIIIDGFIKKQSKG